MGLMEREGAVQRVLQEANYASHSGAGQVTAVRNSRGPLDIGQNAGVSARARPAEYRFGWTVLWRVIPVHWSAAADLASVT